MNQKEEFDFIQKYNYRNSFWENSHVLFDHSRKRMEEFLNFSKLLKKLSELINDFSDSLQENIKLDKKPENDYISTRTCAFSNFIKFTNNVIINLKKISKNFKAISNEMNEKIAPYNYRQDFEDNCNKNLRDYKESLHSVNLSREAYKESADSLVESFLINKYKDNKDTVDLEEKKELLYKRENKYKEEVKKCENIRNEFITFQKGIIGSEEDFDINTSDYLRSCLGKLSNFYNNVINNCKMDNELIESIRNINGNKDIQDFSEINCDIISCPPSLKFSKYSQNLELYFNFDVFKNKLKNKNESEQREIKREVSIEISKFLEETLNKYDTKRDTIKKFAEIANNILNQKTNEEEYQFVINEFEKNNCQPIQSNKETVDDKKNITESSSWENKFDSMHAFLNIFNKLRMFNKKLEKENYDYYVKINEKIVELIDLEDKTLEDKGEIDYDLCDLVLILASTFYKTEEIEGKEEKIYIYHGLRHCNLFQKYEFWVNLVKYQLSEKIIKEKMKDEIPEKKEKKKKNSKLHGIFTNIKSNIKSNISSILKKKEDPEVKIGNLNKYNQLVNAKILTVCFNMIQFVLSSETLNKALYNIFRFYKLTPESKKTTIEMLKLQIVPERNNEVKIDEELLLNNNFDKYKKEKIKENNTDKNADGIKECENKEKDEIKEEIKDEIKEEIKNKKEDNIEIKSNSL